jgi:transposase, IS5 family
MGRKVSLVNTSKDSWIVRVQVVHGNPYDGHTLKAAIDQAEEIAGWRPQHVYCDKDYKGTPVVLNTTEVHLANKKKKSMKSSG